MKDFSTTNFDYLIVGGGVIGLSLGIAILESNPKNKVCIYEKEKECPILFPDHPGVTSLRESLLSDASSYDSENPNIIRRTTTSKTIIKKPNDISKGIQRGEVTHHQDQSILPVNLSTKNTMNKTAVKLNPVPELLFDVLCKQPSPRTILKSKLRLSLFIIYLSNTLKRSGFIKLFSL